MISLSCSLSLSLSLFLSLSLRVRYSALSGDGGEAAASSLRGCVWAGGLAGMGWDGRMHMAEGGECSAYMTIYERSTMHT